MHGIYINVNYRAGIYICSAAVVLLCLVVLAPTVSADWTTYQGDNQATGAGDYDAPTENVSANWISESGEVTYSSPAVYNGSVYVGTLGVDDYETFISVEKEFEEVSEINGSMESFDKSTGALEWSVPTKGSVAYSTPAVSGGSLFFGTMGGTVYSLDAHTGNVSWMFDAGNPVIASPRVDDGTVYVGTRGLNAHTHSHEEYPFYALDREDGSILWEFHIDEGVFGATAVTEDSVYVGGQNGSVYRLGKDTGEAVWEFETDDLRENSTMYRRGSEMAQVGGVTSGPTVHDGQVYFGTYAGDVYSLNKSTGEKDWKLSGTSPFVTSPAVDQDKIYIGGYDTNFYAIDIDEGEQEWVFTEPTREIAKSSPVVADRTVYFGSLDGYLYAVNASTGHEVWRYFTGSPVDSSPAAENGTLYFNSFFDVHSFMGGEEEPDGLEYPTDIQENQHSYDEGEEETPSVTDNGERRETVFPDQTTIVISLIVIWLSAMVLLSKRYY